MEEAAKETVVIVHGTFAAPKPGVSRWYQLTEGMPATNGFIAKLDAALCERGSPARCWAHCTQGNPIFQWSGDNSWIARTHAASALGDYVAKLWKEGWRCHIVAHSHGGNIVVEAMPQIIAAPSPNQVPGTIVTLGCPFMGTMAPISERIARTQRAIDVISWIAFAIFMFGFAVAIAVFMHQEGVGKYFQYWLYDILILSFLLSMVLVARQWFVRTHLTPQVRVWPPFLAISSAMDEAWQVLNFIRNYPNPVAIESNPLVYLLSSLRSNISRSAQIARIHGAKSYRDIGIVAKLVMAITHSFAFFLIFLLGVLAVFLASEEGAKLPDKTPFVVVIVAVYVISVPLFILFLTRLLGETFYSAFLSPFRWCTRQVASLGSVFTQMATYVVHNRGWSVVQASAMGLEGYRFRLPLIQRDPTYVPKNCVKYVDMPKGAEESAMAMRDASIGHHLSDVSQTLSKMVVTAADIDALIAVVEADQSLVHAAYYTDNECIARIADWIAAKDHMRSNAAIAGRSKCRLVIWSRRSHRHLVLFHRLSRA
jgi:hypothetical protein